MIQLLSTSALAFAIGVALGPDDPVGIDDARVEVEPGPRQVSIDAARWQALRAMAELEPPTVALPGPWATQRRVEFERLADGVRVHATWSIQTLEAGWWTGPLVGPGPDGGLRVESATWRGRDVGITHTIEGEAVSFEMPAASRGELELVVFVAGDSLAGGVDGTLELWLRPAVRGELRVTGAAAPEGQVPELIADGEARRTIDGRFWAGEADLALTWVDASHDDANTEGPVAIAHNAVGLTFGDGAVRGRARVTWLVRRGQLDSLTLETEGLGRDLEVVGPNVHAWSRTGERIDIELNEPVEGRVDVDLRWTQAVPGGAEGSLALPKITPREAYRTETFMQIARDGELEVVPKLSGWSAVARAELPDWAGGYIQGTATASFRRDGNDRGASFDLLRFVPLSGPPVVVDVAAYEIATTDEGRSLVQARYDVRNERASHLRVALPAGARMLGVRVNGETVTPARDSGTAQANTEAWRVPIVRSLESVTGTLSFPVEVIFISEAAEWDKKESRELQLPALDAPVAVSRVRVYLPPNYENRVDVGDSHRVGSFSEGEGITYGLGVGAASAEVNRADTLYREALSGWMTNDFRQAQSSLDALVELGASNDNIAGLQANLDLVHGRDQDKNDEAGGAGQSAVVSRRILDQAKIRANDDVLTLHETTREANELEAQGRYDAAEQKLAEAQVLGDRLALLEQSESKEQAVYNQSLSSSSTRVAKKKEGKKQRESKSKSKAKSGPVLETSFKSESPPSEDIVVYEFEDDSVDGLALAPELPQAQELADTTVIDEPAPPPISEPVPAPELLIEADTSQLLVVDDAEALPVGDSTSRDFTAVVEIPPVTQPDALETVQVLSGRVSTKKPRKSRKSKAGKGGKAKAAKTTSDGTIVMVPAAAAPDQNAALAGPVATASSVSVHIPAIGEAVLYQHMLLPEGKIPTVHLEARRQSKSK